MSNFTEEIKNEIISSPLSDRCCKLAALSAFIHTSGSLMRRNGKFGFELVTESDETAEYFREIIVSAFGGDYAQVISSGGLGGKGKSTLLCIGDFAERALTEMKIIGDDADGKYLRFGIDDALVEKECCRAAFLKGAFLGGGSCTLPDEGSYSRTGYHFEVVFSNKITASDFSDLLCSFEILAKLVSRKNDAVVYVKSKEVISDLLNVIGAVNCLEKLNKIVEYKERTNNANRVNNCSVSNIDKTVTASVKLVRAIEIISATIGLQGLEPSLRAVAEARLANKNASMQELSAILGVSKSCLNHRMRKILDLANTLDRD